ncbi:MAG: HEPN domain-containing protein [Rhodocyclaceae bacterium]|nr:HEPN domain-containing protein [Rhodocyclaceae bacterium]
MVALSVAFYDAAVDMAANPQDGYQRSAISRAYYAALHAASEVTPKQFFDANAPAGSTHENLIRAVATFGRSSTPGLTEAKQIARALPMLKEMRVRADYRLNTGFELQDTNHALKSAERVLKLASEIARKNPPPPTQ